MFFPLGTDVTVVAGGIVVVFVGVAPPAQEVTDMIDIIARIASKIFTLAAIGIPSTRL